MVSMNAFSYAAWGNVLLEYESPTIERLIFDNSFLDAHSAVAEDFKIESLIGDDQYQDLREMH